jgi:hypothetical protein
MKSTLSPGDARVEDAGSIHPARGRYSPNGRYTSPKTVQERRLLSVEASAGCSIDNL